MYTTELLLWSFVATLVVCFSYGLAKSFEKGMLARDQVNTHLANHTAQYCESDFFGAQMRKRASELPLEQLFPGIFDTLPQLGDVFPFLGMQNWEETIHHLDVVSSVKTNETAWGGGLQMKYGTSGNCTSAPLPTTIKDALKKGWDLFGLGSLGNFSSVFPAKTFGI